MKIKEITTYLLKAPLREPFYSSTMYFDHRKSLLVKITTDNGIVGWGESGQFGPAELPQAAIDVFKPLLIDEDPLNTEKLWEKMYCYTRDYGRKGSVIEAISGVDMALWDIKGKALGLPVSTLLGGRQRESVQAYATGLYFKPGQSLHDYVKETRQYIDKGFRGIKVKIGSNDPESDLAVIRALREEFGKDILIMTDANHAYNANTAVRVGKDLEEQGVYWFEEPVIPEDVAGYKVVKNALTIAIAGGECEYTHYGFKDLIVNHAVDIAQPDLSVAGGFTACKKISDLASLFGILVVPHVWGSAVAMFATLQFLATILDVPYNNIPRPGNNQTMLECDQTENPLRDNLALNTLVMHGGNIAIPNEPGLGIELNEEVLEKYCVKKG
ncbi:MAG: mandelate racemase/muconate lactonizing enzyme family protein [Lentisphaerae bacterium]|nr:mandelate racemase/muconate lactonizing enzyme family protein [Lentisphaerota bacterium]